MPLENPELKKLIFFLEEAQASDLKAIYVADQTAITDYMIVASGRSSRHVKAIAEQLMEHMKKEGVPAITSTGFETGDWVLLDFGDFIVHIMQPDSRIFYNIEGLWKETAA
jgi:ribosome-associated protein